MALELRCCWRKTLFEYKNNLSCHSKNSNVLPLLCICKLNHHRHISVRVGPPTPQTCLKACKIGNLALVLRKLRHEDRRFSEPEGMG